MRLLSTTVILFALTLFVGRAGAQQLQPVTTNLTAPPSVSSLVSSATAVTSASSIPGIETAVACSQDTVLYSINKATGLLGLNINNVTSARAAGQYFDAPQPITVSGFRFYAYSITTPTQTVTCRLYLAGTDSMPTGTPLRSVSLTIDSNQVGGLPTLENFANFATPVTVSQPYVVVMENFSPNGVALICSDYVAGDGAQEWLASVDIGAVWTRPYNVTVGTVNFNADWLFEPMVTYDLNTTFNYNPPCLTGPNTTVTFTSTSSPILDNRMYSVAAFLGIPRFSHTWNFGDGTGDQNAIDTTHLYAVSNTYAVTKIDTLVGWSTLCVNDTLAAIGAGALPGFTAAPSGLQAVFTNTSVGATGVTWDFGDGNTSTANNPTHTYATPGSYEVCQIVSNACGPNTLCQFVTVVGNTVCNPDTVSYPLAKTTALNALSINNLTSASAGAQYYNAPQPITVYGFEFFGYSASLPLVNLTCEIYSVGPDSLPTGAPLATTTFALDSAFGGGTLDDLRRFVGFSSPVTVTGPYSLVISNPSANNIVLLCSDYTVGNGAQEWLGSAFINGWLPGYGISVGPVSFDADWLFHPLVTYAVNASFTANPNCISGGGTVTFTNNSSPIFGDRMYNLATLFASESFSYYWDFGDGSPVVNAVDTFHTYSPAMVGPYTVTLSDTIFGWTSNCAADTQVVIAEQGQAQFAVAGGGLSFNFTDQSTGNPNAWLWDFGDGGTSTQQNPSYTYVTAGTYTVCLTITDQCGTDSTCQSVTAVCPVLTANFSQVGSNLSYTFTDLTVGSPNNWLWDFGDGNTATTQNPAHTYSTPGIYTVCLTTTDGCTTDSSCTSITVTCPAPVAGFTSSANQLTSSFTDQSTGLSVTGWLWDFGDGNTATTQNPSHTYAVPGTYTVCLTVTGACGTDSSCTTLTVNCNAPTAFYTSNTNLLTASFTDASTAQTGATYAWDFGDGNTSTQQSPTHTYATGGAYTVCLVVTDFCGVDTICQPLTVVCPAPAAFFGSTTSQLTATFTDQSAGNGITAWSWDFGDGNTSSLQNPTHTYAANGTYTVCLTVTDPCGADTTCLPVLINCPAPVASFTSVASQLVVVFTDGSVAQSGATYTWDFGDGNTSNLQSPTHTYAADGLYQVCLTVNDSCGNDSTCQSVNVMTIGIEDKLGQQIGLFPNPAGSEVKLSLDLPSLEDVEVRIFNALGELIQEFFLDDVQQTEVPVDLSNYAEGSYLVNFRIGDSQVVKRLNVIR